MVLCVVITPIYDPFTGEENLPKGAVLDYDPRLRCATELTQETVVYVATNKPVHPYISLCMESLGRIAEISLSTGIVTLKNKNGRTKTMDDDDDDDYDYDDDDDDDDIERSIDGCKEYYNIQ